MIVPLDVGAMTPSGLIFDNSIANEILTLPEIAARLKVSVSGLRKVLRRQGIPGAFKVGQQWRFRWATLVAHLSSAKEAGNGTT